MKVVQCYELFGGIAIKNHAFSFSYYGIRVVMFFFSLVYLGPISRLQLYKVSSFSFCLLHLADFLDFAQLCMSLNNCYQWMDWQG